MSDVNLTTDNWNGLYYSVTTPDNCRGHILYIHGGPGFHSAYFETVIGEVPAFLESRLGWICYDQRGCGRSGDPDQSITHQVNKDDLAAFIRFLQENQNINLLAVMGHSYGGWLCFQTLYENKDIALPAIAVGCAKDVRTARNRSFVMDMLDVKLHQPEAYDKLLGELSDFDQPLWTFQKRVKEVAEPLNLRPMLMWGNLETKKWYEAIKSKVDLSENWALCKQVGSSATLDDCLLGINSAALPSGLLWINGVHDLLMGSDQYYPGSQDQPITFLKSGHYPHLEEPDRFIEEVVKFLF